MGRREAWSAEKSAPDSRTKPTRWEFSRRNANRQKLDNDADSTPPSNDDDQSAKDIRIGSGGEGHAGGAHRHRKKVITKNLKDGKDIQLHNSRTNLINDREVYIEDVVDERDYQTTRRKGEIDDDSMRRHEMDRGSEMEYSQQQTAAVSSKRQVVQDNGHREQLFIKDGNAEILRLITRGKGEEEGIYVNVPQRQSHNVVSSAQPQYIMVDNMGKEILMRRYIEEQANGKQIIREHYQVIPNTLHPTTTTMMPNEIQQTGGDLFVRSHPGSVIYANQIEPMLTTQNVRNQQSEMKQVIETDMQAATSHQSIIQQELENSLKQQNALLRQILLEKERLEEKYNQHENALETQSLPAHSMTMVAMTQTDCEAGTQTDMKTDRRRRARSENDDSMTEDDYEYVRYSPNNSPDGVYYIKKKKPKKKSKHKDNGPMRRVVVVESLKRKIRTPIQEENEEGTPPLRRNANRETKTSILRRKRANEMQKSQPKGPSLKKDTLIEISDSLDPRKQVPKIKEKRKYVRKIHTEEFYEKSDDDDETSESDDDDITRDSLEEPSDDEEVVIKRNKSKKNYRNSTTDMQDFSPDQEYYHRRKSSRSSKRSVRSDQSVSPLPNKARISRRDSTKETVIQTKVRRQAESEPPTSRLKGPAPKPPDQRLKKSLRTKSEMDVSRRDPVFEPAKSVPKYMEWYFNNNNNTNNDNIKREDQKKKIVKKSNLKKTAAPVPQNLRPTSDTIDLRNSNERLDRIKPEPLPRTTASSPVKTPRQMLKEDIQTASKYTENLDSDKNHPLLQHSEHRFEHEYTPGPEIIQPKSKLPHYLYPETPPQINRDTKRTGNTQKDVKPKPKPSPIKEGVVKHPSSKTIITINSATTSHSKQLNASTLEDDHDSGIAMNSLLYNKGRRNPITDKKSVFTIAYDDVKVNRIRTNSESPNN